MKIERESTRSHFWRTHFGGVGVGGKPPSRYATDYHTFSINTQITHATLPQNAKSSEIFASSLFERSLITKEDADPAFHIYHT